MTRVLWSAHDLVEAFGLPIDAASRQLSRWIITERIAEAGTDSVTHARLVDRDRARELWLEDHPEWVEVQRA